MMTDVELFAWLRLRRSMRDSFEISEIEFVESVMAFEEEFSRIMVEREMQEALLGDDDREEEEGEEEEEGYREDRRRLTPLLLDSRRDDGPSWRREREPNLEANIPMAAVVPVADVADVAIDSSSKTRMAVQVDPSENDVRQGEIQQEDGSNTSLMVGVKRSRRFYCTIQ